MLRVRYLAMKKWIAFLLVLSMVGLFPVSLRIADPLLSRPFDPRFPSPVLLIFPERVEIQWITNLSKVYPRPKDARYTFEISPSRQAWVEAQVKQAPPLRPGSTWSLRIRQLGGGKQRIDLEAVRDGITGLIYDASPDEIVPVASRRIGPMGSFLFALIDAGLCCALWLLVWLTWRFLPRGRTSRA
jgi:hypothetical protein